MNVHQDNPASRDRARHQGPFPAAEGRGRLPPDVQALAVLLLLAGVVVGITLLSMMSQPDQREMQGVGTGASATQVASGSDKGDEDPYAARRRRAAGGGVGETAADSGSGSTGKREGAAESAAGASAGTAAATNATPTASAPEVTAVPAPRPVPPEPPAGNGAVVGQPLPPVVFTDLTGKQVDVSALKGKVVLVDFWATWCGPCVGEMPNVKAVYDQYHANGFEVIGISLDQDRKRLDDFLAKNGIPWPQCFDGQGWKNKIAQQFRVRGIPHTILVGRDGTVAAVGLRGETLKQTVGELVGGGKAVPPVAAPNAVAGPPPPVPTAARAETRPSVGENVQVGQPLPAVAFTDLTGKQVDVSALKGKVVLVDFWATWCGPCVGEMPNVKAVYDQYHANGFEVIGISLDQDRKRLDEFLTKNGIPWPQCFDGQGWKNRIAQQFRVRGIPHTILVGRDSNVAAVGLRGEALEQAVTEMMGTKKTVRSSAAKTVLPLKATRPAKDDASRTKSRQPSTRRK